MIQNPSQQPEPQDPPERPERPEPEPLHPEQLTWAALLGKWIDFAQGSLALPNDDAGRKLRASVPDLIMLQAVWFALGEVDELSAGERALGMDRAGVLIERHRAALERTWGQATMPELVREVIDDAAARLAEHRGRPAP
jgi:hypothetical protein